MLAKRASCWLGILLALGAEQTAAAPFDLRGAVSVQSRTFWESAQFAGQRSVDGSLSAQPEVSVEWSEGRDQLLFTPFVRLDSADTQRTHWDLRDLNWQHVSEAWELTLGVQRVFWGVVESNHLVDIINQIDLVEDPDGEEKLGQPMAMLALIKPWGTLDFIVMPWFRERTFPGTHGRLRMNPPVDTDRPRYESAAGAHHVDFAVRYSRSTGAMDFNLYQFRGTSREPEFGPLMRGGRVRALQPIYPQIDQTGLDALWVWNSWLFKLEALHRTGFGAGYVAAVAGSEYTLVGVGDTAMDLGLILELHYDQRAALATTPFNRDVFTGLRLVLNDAAGSSVLVGELVDLYGAGHLFYLEAERRLGDRWRLKVDLRLFGSHTPADPLFYFDRDDYLGLECGRFF
ncbi:MAG: hypothetical protein EXR83_15535 [Gammaproteobacteria bacterium]|nr:hypothetical protein [Gammaproteobacteria bacterium]